MNCADAREPQLDLSLGAPQFDRMPPPPGTLHQVVGLFAGIGGLERGLHRSGHKTLLLCENDTAAKAVLSSRFPDVRLWDDVRTLKALPRETSIVVGGFPCQDLSQAGKTAGISGDRSGLVGEVFRLIEKQRTPWLLLENVPFMLQLGRGRAMDVIATALERLGYRWAYRVVDSRSFGLPQRRRRVYLVASLTGDPRSILFADETSAPAEPAVNGHPVACGFYWTEGIRGLGWAVDAIPTLKGGSTVGIPSSPAILMPGGNVVVPNIVDAERLQGFPMNWTKPAEAVARAGHRWKLVGNAVTVPAAQWLGKRFAKPGRMLPVHLERMRGTHWPTAAMNVGDGRFAVSISEWPVRRAYNSLVEFLIREPKSLSIKATRGFLERTSRSGLRFPPGFLDALRKHERKLAARIAAGQQ